MGRLTTKDFVEKAKKIHGDKYDYSKVKYVNSIIKVAIICPIHGEFYQRPIEHNRGCECPTCAKIKCRQKISDTKENFIKKAKGVHGERYDYSNVEYTNSYTKVCLICPTHGKFYQDPHTHLKGSGCPMCRVERLRKPIYGVGINDSIHKKTKCYQVWHNMLERCYSSKFRNEHQTYMDCSMCDEWLRYSNFKVWFDENYIEGYDLDKDVLVKGNKVYSPDTCVFIPHRINTLLINNKASRGPCPIGVSPYEQNRYQVKITFNKEKSHIGYFNTIQEAFLAYKNAKEKYVKEVALEYYDKGLINERVFNALMNWEIEIKD